MIKNQKRNALVDLMHWQLDPANVENGCCFVPLTMYHNINVAMFHEGRKRGFVNACFQTLNDAGIPNMLALGHWIVPDALRDQARAALGGWRSPLV